MQTVLLDTNMLVSCPRFKIDLFSEIDRLMAGGYELAAPSQVVLELKALAAGRGRDRGFARTALAMMERKGVRVEETNIPADDWLVGKAKEANAIVCTNDAGLKRRLAKEKIQIITLRHRSHLDFA